MAAQSHISLVFLFYIMIIASALATAKLFVGSALVSLYNDTIRYDADSAREWIYRSSFCDDAQGDQGMDCSGAESQYILIQRS
jgi:hypothetical protein